MLVLAQATEAASAGSATAEAVLFWVFAIIAVGAGIAMIMMRNIVHAALMLVVNLLSIAALYLALQSSFLGIVQIIVYAGAIMVLFLFVIMLLGVDRDDLVYDVKRVQKIGAGVAAGLIAVMLLFAFGGAYMSGQSRCGSQVEAATSSQPGSRAIPCAGLEQALVDNPEGSVGVVADRMFQRYTFPFEAAAVLLVVATIGAMVLGRREDEPDPDPAEHTPRAADQDIVLADGPEVA